MQISKVVYSLSGPQYSQIGLSDFISFLVPQAQPQQLNILLPVNQTNLLSILKTAHLHLKMSSPVVDGSFQAKFRLKWDELCHHPRGLHIAFGDDVEHEVMVVAQLLPPAPILVAVSSVQNQTKSYFPSPSLASGPGTYDSNIQHHNQIPQPPTPLTFMSVIPITQSPICVISDIDDTIKLSNILSGARAVFHNVFVKELKDNVIPGMGGWYRGVWDRGIRFHYVVS